MKKAKIIGTGSYLPKNKLTNADLEKLVDTSDEWIFTRTGIKERRIADDNESTSKMGIIAAREAIKDAGIDAKEIDFILVATLTPDYVFPSTACLIQKSICKESKIPSLDVQAACSGYIYCLALAKSFIESGSFNNILIVAAEKLSSIVNYEDRSTCILFGDGAAACIVSNNETKSFLSIKSIDLGADGELSDILMMKGGGCVNPASFTSIKENMHFINMNGNEVFKHAIRRMAFSSKKCLDSINMKDTEIDWLVPHQANIRIIDSIAKKFPHLKEGKVYKSCIKKYGNTSASSIGIALDELLKEQKIKKNENVLLTAFGAGLTWGATILTKEDKE